MARKQKDTVEYFPHDARASEGDTLTILESRFGNDGYTFWFKLLEKLASSDGHCLDCSDNVKWQLLCARAHTTPDNAITIVETLVELKAIDPELWGAHLIWCQHLVDNVAEVYKNRRREIPQRPIITTKNDNTTPNNKITTVDSIPPQTTHEPTLYPPPKSKVKESKVKRESIQPPKIPCKTYGEFSNVFLTAEEYKKLLAKFGDTGALERIERLSSGIASRGYKYKSHYAAILSWDRRDGRNHGRTDKNRGNSGETFTHNGKPETYAEHMQRLKDSVTKPF